MWSYFGSKANVVKLYPKPKHTKIIEPFAGTARYALRLPKGTHLDSITFDCIEAKWLMGFLCNKGLESPRKTVTGLVSVDRPNFANFQLMTIARNLFKIRHWKIRLGCYSDIPNQTATYFIDPPYQKGGKSYVHSKIDYDHLADYCRTREGQVMVCETPEATWLPFKPFTTHKVKKGMQSEGIWMNEKTVFDNVQQKLFHEKLH